MACCCCCCYVTSVMSNSVWPQSWQPTRFPRPWDSPGKNTGVACHFLLQCMKVKSESEVTQSCPTPSDPMGCSLPGSSVHGIFQGVKSLIMQQKQADLGYTQGLVFFFFFSPITRPYSQKQNTCTPTSLTPWLLCFSMSSVFWSQYQIFFIIYSLLCTQGASLVVQTVKTAMQETPVRPPGLGRHLGERNDNPLQCSCLENSMEKGTWWATAHRVAKSQTWLKRLSTCTLKSSHQ